MKNDLENYHLPKRNASTLIVSLDAATLTSLKTAPNLKVIGILEALTDYKFVSYKTLVVGSEEITISQNDYIVFYEEILSKLANFYTL